MRTSSGRRARPARGPSGPAPARHGSTARIAAALGLLAAVACQPRAPGPAAEAWATIGGQRLALEIADTPEKQVLGLGQRDSLAWDRGMLFVYDEPGFHGFWMRGMRFDIDILWIREGRIVAIAERVPHLPPGTPDSALPTYGPDQLSDAVLEVPAGYAQARGLRVGQRVEIEPAPSGSAARRP